MQTFILRRLMIGVVILFILSVTVFLLLRITPGDPAIRICGLNCKIGADQGDPQGPGAGQAVLPRFRRRVATVRDVQR